MIHIKTERKQDGLISREEFMEFFRHDDFSNMVSTDDCHEIFSGVMKGSSDFSTDLINEVLGDYGGCDIVAVDIKKTYYLFGSEAVESLEYESIEILLQQINDNEFGFGLFVFEEGTTPSNELADETIGWNEFSIITEEEYNQLKPFL